jgi:hypothetical protein
MITLGSGDLRVDKQTGLVMLLATEPEISGSNSSLQINVFNPDAADSEHPEISGSEDAKIISQGRILCN